MAVNTVDASHLHGAVFDTKLCLLRIIVLETDLSHLQEFIIVCRCPNLRDPNFLGELCWQAYTMHRSIDAAMRCWLCFCWLSAPPGLPTGPRPCATVMPGSWKSSASRRRTPCRC